MGRNNKEVGAIPTWNWITFVCCQLCLPNFQCFQSCVSWTLLHSLLLRLSFHSLRNVSFCGLILGLIKSAYHGWLSMMTSSEGPFFSLASGPPTLNPPLGGMNPTQKVCEHNRVAHASSRSHECKHWRRRSIWREWLLLSLWLSMRNRQESVWRLLSQRKEIGTRKGMHLVVCALVVKGQSILSRMMNLVLLCFELKFLEVWLNQKGLALVVRALAVKGQSILLRTWTLRSDNGVEPVHHQNRTKRVSRVNCQRWGALVCIDHFHVFCKDYSHPWNTNRGWFLPRQKWWLRSPYVKITRRYG